MDTTSRVQTKSKPVACCACDQSLIFDGRVLVGEVISCEGCGATLEVVGLEPIAIAPLAKIEEEEEDFTDF